MKNPIKSIFPNLGTLAFYDTFSQCIKLNYISELEFEVLMSDVKNKRKNSNAEVFFHEYQHWYDHQSTLWGIKNQVAILNSFNIRLNPDYIDQYYRIPKLLREVERESLINYYFEKYEHIIPNSIEDRWFMSFSFGYRFNNFGIIDESKPISFVRFSSSQGNKICRTPISLASLLESNAIAAEIDIQLNYLSNLEGNPFNSETLNLEHTYFKWLYNPDMTLYSVAAHLVSNILCEKNIIRAFQLSKIISTLVLNIPPKVFPSIKIPKEFSELGNKNKYFLEDGDMGYAYHCLLRNYSNIYEKDKNFNIDSILKCSELPDCLQLIVMIEEEINALEKEITKGPFEGKIRQLIRNGKILLTKRGIFDQGKIDFSVLKANKITPLIIFRDTEISFNNLLINDIIVKLLNNGNITQTEYQFITKYAEEKMYEFYNICGI